MTKKTPNKWLIILAGLGLFFVSGVLVLLLFRVWDVRTVLPMPKAYDPACRAEVEAEYKDCKDVCKSKSAGDKLTACNQVCASNQSKAFAGCLVNGGSGNNGGGTTGGSDTGSGNDNGTGTGNGTGAGSGNGNGSGYITTDTTAPAARDQANTTCYNQCFSATGNGSGCKAACDASATCFPQCVKDGNAAKSCIVPCANGTYKSGVTPTPVTPPSDPEALLEFCQGNTKAPAKCFDCNKDGQVNILDFACFNGSYGKDVQI